MLENNIAPDFELVANTGEKVKLSDYRGKNIVLYFYPKDMTPGCTTQACAFKEEKQSFDLTNTVILGISTDTIERHKKFIEKYDLPFLLLSDEDAGVCKLYDVWKLKKNFGKEYMGIERSTFFINKDGVIEKEWRKVKVKDHIEEVLNFIKNN